MKRFIGIDDGFNTTIGYTDKGELLIYPSKVRIGASSSIQLSSDDSSELPAQYVTQSDGRDVTYSVNANTSDNIVNDDFPTSAAARVLVHHVLHNAKYMSEGDINVCTGLPIRRYYKRSGAKNDALIERKIENMAQGVREAEKGTSVQVASNHVMPESLSALFDLCITERREPNKPTDQNPKVKVDKERFKSHIAFFDVGGRTTDIAISTGGTINKGEFDTVNAGMEDVYRELREHIRDETGIDAIPDRIIRHAYKFGVVDLNGEEMDVSDLVSDAISETVEKIRNLAANVIGSKSKLIDEVVFLGGGAQELYSHGLDKLYKRQTLLENPIAANARGFYKWLRYIKS